MRPPGWMVTAHINCVVLHVLGYNTDSMDDGLEVRFCQGNVSRTMGSICGTLNRDTHISTQEGMAHCLSITCYGTKMTKTLEALDNFESGKTPANLSASMIILSREGNWLPRGGPSLSTLAGYR